MPPSQDNTIQSKSVNKGKGKQPVNVGLQNERTAHTLHVSDLFSLKSFELDATLAKERGES
jgi:hypothetical protein